MHGSFKVTQMSQTYNLLFEVSKLLSKSHGHQKKTKTKQTNKQKKSGKADEWQSYLKSKKLPNFIVSLLPHRFNIVFFNWRCILLP